MIFFLPFLKNEILSIKENNFFWSKKKIILKLFTLPPFFFGHTSIICLVDQLLQSSSAQDSLNWPQNECKIIHIAFFVPWAYKNSSGSD